MSMRHYGIQSKCMLLKMKDFYELCTEKRIDTNKNINELFENFYNNNKPKDFSEIEISDLLDISYNIDYAYITMETDGQFTLYDESGYGESEYFRDEDLILFELKKDTLFECYKDFNEIYDEIINNLKEIGIVVDREYVKGHFGMFEGGYYA